MTYCQEQLMAYKFMAVDTETGEVVEIQQRQKKKFGKDFFMADQVSAIALSADKDLTGTDMRVLWFLLGTLDFNNMAVVPQSFISKKVGIQPSAVSSSIKKLCEKGYIKKICTNGNNAYEINPGFAVKGDRKKHNEKD